MPLCTVERVRTRVAIIPLVALVFLTSCGDDNGQAIEDTTEPTTATTQPQQSSFSGVQFVWTPVTGSDSVTDGVLSTVRPLAAADGGFVERVGDALVVTIPGSGPHEETIDRITATLGGDLQVAQIQPVELVVFGSPSGSGVTAQFKGEYSRNQAADACATALEAEVSACMAGAIGDGIGSIAIYGLPTGVDPGRFINAFVPPELVGSAEVSLAIVMRA